MRTARFFTQCLLLCTLLASCEKVKKLTNDVQSKLTGEAASGLVESGGVKIKPDLEAQIDRSEEGYLFRRDRNFPTELDVRVEGTISFDDCHVSGASPYGAVKDRLSLVDRKIRFYEKRANSIDCTIEVDQIEKKPLDDTMSDEEKASNITKNKDVGASLSFSFDGKSWKTKKTNDFAKAMSNRRHESELAFRMVEDGLITRSRWFGEKRVKIGDKVQLSEGLLNLVFPEGTGGSATMTLVDIEGVHGHPCGVFEIIGNIDFIERATEDTPEAKGQMSLEAGSKVWLSLLYPVVLREDFQTVTTLKTGELKTGGGIISGKMKLMALLDWQIVENEKAAAPK